MYLKNLISYIFDGYKYIFKNPEDVIRTLSYVFPFILAITLKSNYLLGLLLLSLALNGIAVYVYHWLFNI